MLQQNKTVPEFSKFLIIPYKFDLLFSHQCLKIMKDSVLPLPAEYSLIHSLSVKKYIFPLTFHLFLYLCIIKF
jgi:hypothetical protein